MSVRIRTWRGWIGAAWALVRALRWRAPAGVEMMVALQRDGGGAVMYAVTLSRGNVVLPVCHCRDCVERHGSLRGRLDRAALILEDSAAGAELELRLADGLKGGDGTR